MDRDAFDGLARLLASSPNRRAALGALLGAGMAGTLGIAEAAKKNRKKKRTGRKSRKGKGTAQVSAQAADCLSPGPSSNMNGCDFGGDPFGGGADFSGQDLSGSSMVGTIFRNAVLVGTNLSSSNMRGANFRGADLTCADLSSSVLRNADFRGFAPLGRPTNLTGADLRSSGGCGTVLTNQFTIICGTTWCDGSVRDDDCPGGTDACCSDANCGGGEACVDNQCVTVCDQPRTATSCDCIGTFVGGVPVCVDTANICNKQACSSNDGCALGEICVRHACGCPGEGHCVVPCTAECACTVAPSTCAEIRRCNELSSAARRTGADAAGKDAAR